jgi:hypothetical protein
MSQEVAAALKEPTLYLSKLKPIFTENYSLLACDTVKSGRSKGTLRRNIGRRLSQAGKQQAKFCLKAVRSF